MVFLTAFACCWSDHQESLQNEIWRFASRRSVRRFSALCWAILKPGPFVAGGRPPYDHPHRPASLLHGPGPRAQGNLLGLMPLAFSVAITLLLFGGVPNAGPRCAQPP